MPEQNPNPAAALLGSDTDTPSAAPASPLPAGIAPSAPQTPAPAQQNQPQTQADPGMVSKIARHAKLGQLAEHLFRGSHEEYAVDPKTGTMTTTTVKERPGEFFRNLAASALLGMAAGSPSANGGQTDFGTGVGRGLGAAMGLRQQRDEQRYQRAQDQFKNQQAARKLDEGEQKIENERLRNHALSEQWNARQLQLESTANHRAGELLAAENRLNQRKLESDRRFGGVPASVPGNGDPGNGKDMQKLFTTHPEMFKPPANYTRSITKDYDLSELKYDYTKNGWEDKDGNPADIENYTTWNVTFVPINGTKQVYTLSQLQTMFPTVMGSVKGDPKKEFSVTPAQFAGYAEHEAMLTHEKWLDNYKQTHETVATTLAEGRNRLANLHSQYQASVRDGDDQAAARIQDQIDTLNDNIEKQIQQADPHLRPQIRNAIAPPALQEATPTTPAPPAPGRTAPTPATPSAPTPSALVKPPKPGAPMPRDVMKKYAAANGFDKEKAKTAAQRDGWGAPAAQ
jgi:hypothetical protein